MSLALLKPRTGINIGCAPPRPNGEKWGRHTELASLG